MLFRSTAQGSTWEHRGAQGAQRAQGAPGSMGEHGDRGALKSMENTKWCLSPTGTSKHTGRVESQKQGKVRTGHKIFEKIMAQNLANLMNTINVHAVEAQQTPGQKA